MTRRCPNCGAVVPAESLNCPYCYHDVPRTITGPENDYHKRTYTQYQEQLTKRRKSRMISLVLAIIPAFIGLLGLAQIYQDHRDPLGWKILCGGLILYLILVGMIAIIHKAGGIGVLLLAIPTIFIGALYLLLALFALLLTNMGFVTLFGRRL